MGVLTPFFRFLRKKCRELHITPENRDDVSQFSKYGFFRHFAWEKSAAFF
jgi:hypothetical protein